MKPPLLAALLAMVLAGTVQAQTFPAKPVRIIVPFPAGGAVDTVARAFPARLAELWKQPVVVENRVGAGGNIGADAVAKAPADGHVLLITTNGLAISPSLYRKLPFDAERDLAAVSQLTGSYLVLTASPRFEAASVRELVELAKAKPGAITYGSTGLGVAPHLVMELFKGRAGIDLLHVPYKGDAQVGPALLAGEVQVAFMPTIAVIGPIKAGRMKGLAVSTLARVAVLPEVPTLVEAGLPEFEYTGWLGLFATGGTPRETLARIHADFAKVLAVAELRERLPSWGYDPVGSTPEEFAARFRRDLATFARIIRDARVPAQE